MAISMLMGRLNDDGWVTLVRKCGFNIRMSTRRRKFRDLGNHLDVGNVLLLCGLCLFIVIRFVKIDLLHRGSGFFLKIFLGNPHLDVGNVLLLCGLCLFIVIRFV